MNYTLMVKYKSLIHNDASLTDKIQQATCNK